MWSFASKCVAGTGSLKLKKGFQKPKQNTQESSDDESSSKNNELECPICCESFNIFENVPYVLWCGHSLCKNCVLGLQWAIVKIPPLPIQLPLLISCPWCNLLSPRLVFRGNLRFPRKNYFLLWMVERINGDKVKKTHDSCGECEPVWPAKLTPKNQLSWSRGQTGGSNRVVRMHLYIQKAVLYFIELTAKLPLVLIFLLIVLYAVPASAIILVVYVLVTILVALPSFLVLYFAYPSLDWLVREIVA